MISTCIILLNYRASCANTPLSLDLYRQAMKPEFASEVEGLTTANRYRIQATLKVDADVNISGVETVDYTNRSTDMLSDIEYRLYPNIPGYGGTMTIDSASVNTVPAHPQLSDQNTVLALALDPPLKPGESVAMTLAFRLHIPAGSNASFGRFGYQKGIISGAGWYPTLSVYTSKTGWWKDVNTYLNISDPAYSEIGFYDVDLVMPSNLVMTMSGTRIGADARDDHTTDYHYVTGPMRDHCFMASSRYKVTTVEQDGTQIHILSYNDSQDGDDDAVRIAKAALHTFTTTFGAYPYRDYSVVENPTDGGVEYPGVVQVGDQYWHTGNTFFEIVVAHETGHQWFYALVGNDQVEHPWIDESLTSYLEIVYLRSVYGDSDRVHTYIEGIQKRYKAYLASGSPDYVLNLPVSDYRTPVAYVLVIYTKGPLFLLELEREFGESTVYAGLKVYFEHEKYQVAHSSDIKAAFESASRHDLTALFNKWVGAVD
jgi:hypothetical protein